MRTSEVLNKAADLIQQHGWTHVKDQTTRNPWGGAGRPMCLEGGILAALGLEPSVNGLGDEENEQLVTCPAYKAVQEYLGFEPKGDIKNRLYRFNDAEGRTAQEVIEVLRATALLESAKENNSVEVKA